MRYPVDRGAGLWGVVGGIPTQYEFDLIYRNTIFNVDKIAITPFHDAIAIRDERMTSPQFLDDRTIRALPLSGALVLQAVREVFRSLHGGTASAGLKTQVALSAGGYAQALPAVCHRLGVAGVKWVTVPPPETGRPIGGVVILTDAATGGTRAVMDATWITEMRTAAMTVLAAQALAPAQSRRLGLIGAGRQALSHLELLKLAFPAIDHVAVHAPGDCRLILAAAERLGLEAGRVAQPRDAVSGMDIVVSTVPAAGLDAPFLDAGWLEECAFASLVDLGRSWIAASLAGAAVLATDDLAQSAALRKAGKMPDGVPFTHLLAELAAGAGAVPDGGRRIFLFGGSGVADIAVARLVSDVHAGARHETEKASGPCVVSE